MPVAIPACLLGVGSDFLISGSQKRFVEPYSASVVGFYRAQLCDDSHLRRGSS